MYEAELKELTPNQWELFAEDILFHLGFVGYVGPSVGADEGLDMLVERDDVRYLVSCKHYLVSGRNVGPSDEQDISDRLRRHDCEGFIAIYSTQPTSALKRKLLDLSKRGVKVVELYKSDVMDIMPSMMGFTLSKYFARPQDILDEVRHSVAYKPLCCMKEGCGKDILDRRNIPWSMASLVRSEGKLSLIYGCKPCINYLPDMGWAEISQIRYLEQLLRFRSLMDGYLQKLHPSDDFFKAWAQLQEGIFQILIPPGWGRWLPF